MYVLFTRCYVRVMYVLLSPSPPPHPPHTHTVAYTTRSRNHSSTRPSLESIARVTSHVDASLDLDARSIMFLRAVSRRTTSARAYARGGPSAVTRRHRSTTAASAATNAAPVWTGDVEDGDHKALAQRAFARYGNPEAVTFAHRGILNDVEGEVRARDVCRRAVDRAVDANANERTRTRTGVDERRETKAGDRGGFEDGVDEDARGTDGWVSSCV